MKEERFSAGVHRSTNSWVKKLLLDVDLRLGIGFHSPAAASNSWMLEQGTMETCAQERHISFSMRWTSLGLSVARSVCACHQCTKCKVCWGIYGVGWIFIGGIWLKGTLNASAHQTLWIISCSQICGNDFVDGPFLFQHDCAPVHKARAVKTWMSKFDAQELDWPEQNTWVPDLLVQCQSLTTSMQSEIPPDS